jgi:cytochrome c peroxidase
MSTGLTSRLPFGGLYSISTNMHPKMMIRDAAVSLLFAATLTACSGDLPSSSITQPSDINDPALAVTVAAPANPVVLGKSIYNDLGMSRYNNQSCASCHSAAWGFTAPADGSIRSDGNTLAFFQGSIPGRFGNRKAPSAAYASMSPAQKSLVGGDVKGGLFWDGRAKGSAAMTPIQEQALGPFLADKEHAFSRICILWEINKRYAADFNALSPAKLTSVNFNLIGTDAVARDAYCHTGTADLPYTPTGATATEATNLTNAYNQVGVFLGAFQASPEVNRFSSKYDEVEAGRGTWTAEEKLGHDVFDDNCERCHESNGRRDALNDHEFYNLGLPRNPLRATLLDRGLGAVMNDARYNGFFRNATTRNVDKRPLLSLTNKTYMHNGVFNSLAQVVHFYNTRDIKACPTGVTYGAGWVRFPTNADPVAARLRGICWPRPDYPSTMSNKLGNMKLTARQEAAVVAYMRTMTDR